MSVKNIPLGYLTVAVLIGSLFLYVRTDAQILHDKKAWSCLQEFKVKIADSVTNLNDIVRDASTHIFKATTVQGIEKELDFLIAALSNNRTATYEVNIDRLSQTEITATKQRITDFFSRIISLVIIIRAKDMLTHSAYVPLHLMQSNNIHTKLYTLGECLKKAFPASVAIDKTWFYDPALGYEHMLTELANLKADIEVATKDTLNLAVRKRQEEQRTTLLTVREAKRKRQKTRQAKLLASRKANYKRQQAEKARLLVQQEIKRKQWAEKKAQTLTDQEMKHKQWEEKRALLLTDQEIKRKQWEEKRALLLADQEATRKYQAEKKAQILADQEMKHKRFMEEKQAAMQAQKALVSEIKGLLEVVTKQQQEQLQAEIKQKQEIFKIFSKQLSVLQDALYRDRVALKQVVAAVEQKHSNAEKAVMAKFDTLFGNLKTQLYNDVIAYLGNMAVGRISIEPTKGPNDDKFRLLTETVTGNAVQTLLSKIVPTAALSR